MTETAHIHLHGFDVVMQIGIHDFEQKAPQRVRLDMDVEIDSRFINTSEAIDQVFDYDFLRLETLRIIEAEPITLQETLCRRVMDMILARDGVVAATVRTSKPDVYPDCEGVGVSLSVRKS